eukprot:365021-Chlamydomonas_euryale.AAC.1
MLDKSQANSSSESPLPSQLPSATAGSAAEGTAPERRRLQLPAAASALGGGERCGGPQGGVPDVPISVAQVPGNAHASGEGSSCRLPARDEPTAAHARCTSEELQAIAEPAHTTGAGAAGCAAPARPGQPPAQGPAGAIRRANRSLTTVRRLEIQRTAHAGATGADIRRRQRRRRGGGGGGRWIKRDRGVGQAKAAYANAAGSRGAHAVAATAAAAARLERRPSSALLLAACGQAPLRGRGGVGVGGRGGGGVRLSVAQRRTDAIQTQQEAVACRSIRSRRGAVEKRHQASARAVTVLEHSYESCVVPWATAAAARRRDDN